MNTYEVLAEGWLEDGNGIGAYRLVGDPIVFSAIQVKYLEPAGIVKLPTAAPAKSAKSKD
jgi:hypothetical protein